MNDEDAFNAKYNDKEKEINDILSRINSFYSGFYQ